MHCLVVNDIVLISEKGVVHPDLQAFYNAYRAEQGTGALPPRQWIEFAARGAARRWLQLRLGAAVSAITGAASPAIIHIAGWPIPNRFLNSAGELNTRFRDLVGYLNRSDISGKLWDRLALFADPAGDVARLLQQTQEVSRGYLNILKGNIAEVFSMPHQITTLARIREVYPDAVLVTGVRVRTAGSEARRLYSDNIIATFTSGGNLVVHHVFEVKAGYNGGLEGASQVVRWDHRFEGGVELLVPAEAEIFVLGRSHETSGVLRQTAHEHIAFLEPNVSARAGADFSYGHNMPDAGARTVALRGASRDVVSALGQSAISPAGMSSVGLDQLTHLGPDVDRLTLGLQHDEIDYLVKYLLLNR